MASSSRSSRPRLAQLTLNTTIRLSVLPFSCDPCLRKLPTTPQILFLRTRTNALEVRCHQRVQVINVSKGKSCSNGSSSSCMKLLVGYVSDSLKAALSSVKAFALSHNGNGHLGIPQHRLNHYMHPPYSWGRWVLWEWTSLRTQHSPSVPQSTMLPAYWSACYAKRSIREHGHYLTVLGP